jgi:hypothetical protein
LRGKKGYRPLMSGTRLVSCRVLRDDGFVTTIQDECFMAKPVISQSFLTRHPKVSMRGPA